MLVPINMDLLHPNPAVHPDVSWNFELVRSCLPSQITSMVLSTPHSSSCGRDIFVWVSTYLRAKIIVQEGYHQRFGSLDSVFVSGGGGGSRQT